jgi:hypothetical protein
MYHFDYQPEEKREASAVEYELEATMHRARGEFEAAVRWDDYARSIRRHGHTTGYTANGTRAAWTCVEGGAS